MICKAIKNKNLISFTYNNEVRVVQPLRYGISEAGHHIVRAYQIKDTTGWKIFLKEKMLNIKVFGNYDVVADGNYSKGDKQISPIFCEL